MKNKKCMLRKISYTMHSTPHIHHRHYQHLFLKHIDFILFNIHFDIFLKNKFFIYIRKI